MRHFINIVEAILYRGDANEIEAYELNKTFDNALFGRGIYLTDNREVAGDYTINKGARDQVVSDPGVEYKSQRDAIAGLLMDILNNELKWPEEHERLKKIHSDRWWNDEIPDHPGTRAMRFGDPGYQEARERQQEDFREDLIAAYKTALQQAKKLYKARAADYRITKDTMGRWTIVKADRPGRISRFEIPDEYLARTLHGDRPLTDEEIKIVGAFIEETTPQGTDFRDSNNEHVSTEDGSHNFWKWVEVFKSRGSGYAWRGGDDWFMGGKGENPSLDQIWNGQHGGFNIFYKSGDAFIPYMQRHGYTGIEYHGGIRIGDNVRGGGGVRHTSYVLWDADFVNKCRIDQEPVNDPQLDYNPSKLRSKALYSKHRYPDKY